MEIQKQIRDKVRELLTQQSGINKLMTDKVNDFILVEEQPLSIPIGDRTIFIGNFTIENNYKFWEGYGKILANIGLKFINFDLLSKPDDMYKAIMIHKRLYKELMILIKKTIIKQQAYLLNKEGKRIYKEWKNCTWGYFKKHISIEKLLQICYGIYLYNFDAEKKNFKILLQKMGNQALLETYMYSWLVNCPGLIVKSGAVHITRPSYWSQDGQNSNQDNKLKDDEKIIIPVK